jgi:hypothetical protein
MFNWFKPPKVLSPSLKKYDTRVVELTLGDGRVVYAPQMAWPISIYRRGEYVKWCGILLSGKTFNNFADAPLPHLTEDYPKNTVEDKETACNIAKEFRIHLTKDKVMFVTEVECVCPRKIN